MTKDEKIEKLLHKVGAYVVKKGDFWLDYFQSPWISASITDRRDDDGPPNVKFKIANGEVGISNDGNYEMPLSELRQAIGKGVQTISIKMTPDGEILMRATGADRKSFKRGGWRVTYDPAAGAVPKSTAEQLAVAKDVSGVPPELVPCQRELNKSIRQEFPHKPEHEIPLKFWNAEDDVMFSALQSFPLQFAIHDCWLKGLPPGYKEAYVVFEIHWQHICEGLTLAISNVGSDVILHAAKVFRKAGLERVADLYLRALDEYDDDTYENPSKEYSRIRNAISNATSTAKYGDFLLKYFRQPGMFESKARARC